MQFELSEALVDDILFAMEDQVGDFYLDTVEGIIVGGVDWEFEGDLNDDDGEGGERFISLPEWDSSDGFKLMERFAAGFRNPVVREELHLALDRGRGVFRAFKNVLGLHPEAEKLWFLYKEKEMKNHIRRWYNGLREEWGLEKLGLEPEETDDLVLEDFNFRPFQTGDVSGDSGGAFGITAETSGGDFAGCIYGIVLDSVLYIQNLEVKGEFRGLGLGEALLAKFIEKQKPEEVHEALLDLPSCVDGFSRVLLRRSFKPYVVRYRLDLKNPTLS